MHPVTTEHCCVLSHDKRNEKTFVLLTIPYQSDRNIGFFFPVFNQQIKVQVKITHFYLFRGRANEIDGIQGELYVVQLCTIVNFTKSRFKKKIPYKSE